ncbi:hypothetical protein SmJEL517_g04386 [Synchytrium microbalum]|uniref:Uncharacterized protein n=1 Tax=Synchytrium microbalum TaxID=1806994 RepID=A0A507BYL8_9FUNG|nr:uncharacterized protein SmJEL517_g04386 [Synchytrium microbalum]TPX32512.1 hypothetical protein SmJEL517_g04386 [Synchytrium microbalum]
MATIENVFEAIKAGDSDKVRALLLNDKTLLTQKHRDPTAKPDAAIELDLYKFCGAYLGQMTALQYSLLVGQDSIANDIAERTFKEDLDVTFGGGNTALHLASLLGAKDLVKLLLEHGAQPQLKNNKGFSPVDMSDEPDMLALFSQ